MSDLDPMQSLSTKVVERPSGRFLNDRIKFQRPEGRSTGDKNSFFVISIARALSF